MDTDEYGRPLRQQASAEQALAWVGDNLPRLWHRLYTNAVGSGFTEQQAMVLVCTYITAQGARGAGG